MATVSEQRRQLRKRVFKAAQIVVTESAPILECRARDLSDYGARLCLSATYGLPQQFDIIIDGKEGRPLCLENLYGDGCDVRG